MSTVIKHKQFPNHKVYETTVAGRPLKIEVGKMAELDELVNQRNAVTKELVDKQNKVVCPTCGKQSPSTALYCSNCGTKLTGEE